MQVARPSLLCPAASGIGSLIEALGEELGNGHAQGVDDLHERGPGYIGPALVSPDLNAVKTMLISEPLRAVIPLLLSQVPQTVAKLLLVVVGERFVVTLHVTKWPMYGTKEITKPHQCKPH